MKKDIFQKVVGFLIVFYVFYVIGACISIYNTCDVLVNLKHFPQEIALYSKPVLISGLVVEIMSIFAFAFAIYCVYRIGENKREIENLKNHIVKHQMSNKQKYKKAIKNCDACGRVIYENSVVCPHCKSVTNLADNSIKETLLNSEIEFCKNCGYQLFEDDLDCPNCGNKR